MYTQQDSFNPMSRNPDFWALKESSPKTWSSVFTRRRLHQ